MIGAQAWENMGVHSHRTKDLIIEHEGMRYTYHTWSDDWVLFDSHEEFKAWAMADVRDNGGGYADEIHNIEEMIQ